MTVNAYPKELLYSPTHEWVRVEKDNIVTVGITEHAQHALGDLVFVELPKRDKQVKTGEELAVVESVKTASDVYSPACGAVVEINETLQSQPGTVNTDPYGAGWLFRLKISDPNELKDLLNAQKYQTLVEDGA